MMLSTKLKVHCNVTEDQAIDTCNMHWLSLDKQSHHMLPAENYQVSATCGFLFYSDMQHVSTVD